MKKYLFFIVLVLLFSCRKENSSPHNFNEDIYSPVSSGNFVISGEENSDNTLISIFNPWQGAEDMVSEMIILRDDEKYDGYRGLVLKGNAERIVCMSSTHVAMLDALGAVDKIVGVSGLEYIKNPEIHKRNIPDIGYEGFIDYETLLSIKPDLILLFSVNGASSMEPKLKELKIPYLYIGDYVEEDPLGKAEWIVPIAEIIGKRKDGIQKFQEISSRYNLLKDKVATSNISRPKVMVNAPFLDSWFMPSTESYVAKMINDAGGEYIYKKNTGNSSLPIDIEEALKLVSESDFWINIGTVKNKEELDSSFPKFNEAPCVLAGNIYNNNAITTQGGGNDCYESGVVNPDLILSDMIKIFHPDLIESDFTYYHQLK